SGRRCLQPVVDKLFANVSLSLDAPGAAAVVQKLRVEAVREMSCGLDHHVEALDRVAWTGKHHEEAHSGKRPFREPLEVERARLGQAGYAEQRLVGVGRVLVMKDTVPAVLEP